MGKHVQYLKIVGPADVALGEGGIQDVRAISPWILSRNYHIRKLPLID